MTPYILTSKVSKPLSKLQLGNKSRTLNRNLFDFDSMRGSANETKKKSDTLYQKNPRLIKAEKCIIKSNCLRTLKRDT